jgi:hypothetical protein
MAVKRSITLGPGTSGQCYKHFNQLNLSLNLFSDSCVNYANKSFIRMRSVADVRGFFGAIYATICITLVKVLRKRPIEKIAL